MLLRREEKIILLFYESNFENCEKPASEVMAFCVCKVHI